MFANVVQGYCTHGHNVRSRIDAGSFTAPGHRSQIYKPWCSRYISACSNDSLLYMSKVRKGIKTEYPVSCQGERDHNNLANGEVGDLPC